MTEEIQSTTLAQPEQEPAGYQFRQRSGVGKGPQTSAPWCDWCAIDRETYEIYQRVPNRLVQVRPVYASPVQSCSAANEDRLRCRQKLEAEYNDLIYLQDSGSDSIPLEKAMDIAELGLSFIDALNEPQAAGEIEQLRTALSFYADGRRYQGPNQRPIPNDPFAKPGAVYINDVTRDGGSIASLALSRPLSRGGNQ